MFFRFYKQYHKLNLQQYSPLYFLLIQVFQFFGEMYHLNSLSMFVQLHFHLYYSNMFVEEDWDLISDYQYVQEYPKGNIYLHYYQNDSHHTIL